MNDDKIKISLTKLIILIVLAIIIVVGLVWVFLKLDKEPSSNTTNTTNTAEPTYVSKPTKKPEVRIEDMENEFSFEFLKLENNKENIVYSPLSIKYALKMLGEGASGNTKKEIDNVCKDLALKKYESIDDALSLANCIYVRDSYKDYIKDEFKKILTDEYDAEVNYDSFKNAKNINKWIEKKTLGIIKNMIDDNIVSNPDSKAILINALAIDMKWDDSFETDKTYGEDFYIKDNKTIKATMMHKKTYSDDILYYKDKNIVSLSMDLEEYDDTQFEFIAIMPDKDLDKYIEDFSNETLNEITDKYEQASSVEDGVNISIPKFKFDYDLSLKEDLMSLGIKEAFDEIDADFSEMTDEPNGLYVSDALHKADIEFSEDGIKAAAVTAFIMMAKNAIENPTKPEEVKFDKPFMYIIRDKESKEIWFVGAVYEPNHWDDDKEEYNKY